MKVNGIVGDPPEYAGTTLSFEGSGANLAHFRDLANVALPAESFEITGKLVQGDGAIDLEAVRARLGSHRFQVTGQLSTEARFSGTDLQLNAKGPDASQLAAIAELSDVPAEPYSIDGRVRVLEKGYRVTGVAGSLGSLAVKVNGFVAPPPTLVGSDLQIHVEDPDISHPAAIAGIEGLPHDAFSIDTRLRIEDRGYRIDDFEATVGDMALGAKGLVSALPEFEGTRMHLTARGPKLSSLNPYIDQTGLQQRHARWHDPPNHGFRRHRPRDPRLGSRPRAGGRSRRWICRSAGPARRTLHAQHPVADRRVRLRDQKPAGNPGQCRGID
ncbi:MAG: hypothetical protein IFK92_01995 [Acidobacteria bacterium]|nr:hypothetical protein [Candidatus Sulfomarinibacter kjeldsenii]